MSSTIDYRLAKRAVVRRLQDGELSIEQVCDAHPELVRASTHMGTRTGRACPVCAMAEPGDVNWTPEPPTVLETTWLYGDSLRQKNGHLVEDPLDLAEYEQRFASFMAWTVECCVVCRWNHLISRRLCGFSHFPGYRATHHLRQSQGGGRE